MNQADTAMRRIWGWVAMTLGRTAAIVVLAALMAATVRVVPSGAQVFTRVTSGIAVTDGGASRGVNWIDADGNGSLDLFVTNGPSTGQDNCLYLNSGPPAYEFTKVLGDPITSDHAKSDGSSWADADNDGDLDAFVVNWYADNNLFYLNNGDGSFTQVLDGEPVNDGGYSETCSWGDYDADGWIDLLASNSGDAAAQENFLYRNLGDGTFERILSGPVAEDIYYTRGVTWVDYDHDHDLDLFAVNENNQANNLYRNLRTETGLADFERVAAAPLTTDLQSSFSASWGDYDNDGDLDVFVANTSSQNNSLYANNGNGTFTKILSGAPVSDGGWSVCAAWGDDDNDGDLDLFVTNAFGTTRKVNFLYQNQLVETGSATFQKVTTGTIVTELGWSYGCAFGDPDRDGDLDLFIAKTFSSENNAYFRNDNANGNRWLELRLAGVAANRAALGTRVTAWSHPGGTPMRQVRVVEGQSGYCGQNLDLHFGLGSVTALDSLVVEWPSGATERLRSVAANQYLVLQEGSAASGIDPVPAGSSGALESGQIIPNPFRGSTGVRFRNGTFAGEQVSILSADGRVVRVLAPASLASGAADYLWDGYDEAGNRVPAGAYFLRREGSGRPWTGKVTRLR